LRPVAGLAMVAGVSVHHAVLAAIPHQVRALVRVTGDDALRFLQGLLTADVGELTPGRATPAALLTVKGKIVSEVWVLAVSEHEPWLALPGEVAEAVLAKLDGHIIMDDVELEALPELGCAIVWADAGSLATGDLQAREGVRAFQATHPLPGVLLVGPHEALAALAGDDVGERADAEAFMAARVRHARPAWGYEIGPERFPPEVGFVDAVSYDKGCYLGQEPLSRIHNRGQVNRVMVRVTLGAAPAGDGPLALHDGELEVGTLTSWTAAGEGLAVVKRVRAKPGTVLEAQSQGLAVTVSSEPLGDDPGRAGRAQTGAQTGTVSLGGRR
jgi:tRNA-modifying protein YgfZ